MANPLPPKKEPPLPPHTDPLSKGDNTYILFCAGMKKVAPKALSNKATAKEAAPKKARAKTDTKAAGHEEGGNKKYQAGFPLFETAHWLR